MMKSFSFLIHFIIISDPSTNNNFNLLDLIQFLIFIIIFYTLFLMMLFNNLHPLIGILSLTSYTIAIAMAMSVWNYTPLYSLIMFLMVISGMIIIMLYFISLINDYKQSFTKIKNELIKSSLTSILITFSLLSNNSFFDYMKFNNFNNTSNLNEIITNNLSLMYMNMYMLTTLMSILYLFSVMTFAMKLCSFSNKPLRSTKFNKEIDISKNKT